MIEITYNNKGEEGKAYFRATKEQAVKKFSRLGYNMEIKEIKEVDVYNEQIQ